MLTLEKEQSIRKFLENGSYGHPEAWYEDYKMFLAEIDMLRNVLKLILKLLDEEEYPKTIRQIKRALKNADS